MATPDTFWIFGRAEKQWSPVGQAGYQTLWKSTGLSSAAVSELEDAARCFDLAPEGGEAAAERWQLCHLSNGSYGLTVTRTMAAEPETDLRGRSTFLCLGLVFPPQEIVNGFDPFGWIQTLTTKTSFKELAEVLGPPGRCPEIPDRWLRPAFRQQEPGNVHPEAMEALLVWLLDPNAPAIEKEPILLFGNRGTTEAILQRAFALLPPAGRVRFTFSTAMDSCVEPSSRFNLLATNRDTHHPRRTKLDLASGRWLGAAPKLSSESRRFVRFQAANRLSGFQAESAWQAECSLHGRMVNSVPPDPRIVADYYLAHPADFKSRIERLVIPIGKASKRRFADYLLQELTAERSLMLFRALGQRRPAVLGQELRQWASNEGVFLRNILRMLLWLAGPRDARPMDEPSPSGDPS